MKTGSVKAVELGKQYMVRSYRPTLMEAIGSLGRRRNIWAINNVNLTINPGDQIGIIGDNGSGKTTLLRLISGITVPTIGTVRTGGKVAPLLQLSAGFRPELTGRENVFLNGMLLGMEMVEIQAKLDSIIKFAGFSEFFDSQLFTYSSGMMMRLAFSVAIHSNPDILLIDDEAIFVGDREFQKKIRLKLKEFRESGKTVIIVSHILAFLRFTVDKMIYMENGKVKNFGPVGNILDEYKSNRR